MRTTVWISGASAGIGAALAASVPFEDATTYDLSRSGGASGRTTHVRADLADPASWPFVAAHFAATLAEQQPRRAVFIHNAGTIDPIGPAGTTDPAAYTAGVLLNAASPPVLGSAFLSAVATAGTAEATLVIISSGAARTPYAGWSAYCAAKAAVDQWVRAVGLEQADRDNPVTVLAIAPGVVSTNMQATIRQASPQDLPTVDRFITMHEEGALSRPEEAAAGIWAAIGRDDLATGSVLDLRALDAGTS
ncbi:MAG TPA: SDR family NAD(P)-dependent oxidoreductase [Euzebya sp.]|nr:SDR family NAD(P)-dependent oxidoreductase [Euzebya sp.]